MPFVTSQKTDLRDGVFFSTLFLKKKKMEQGKEVEDGLFLLPRSDRNVHEQPTSYNADFKVTATGLVLADI